MSATIATILSRLRDESVWEDNIDALTAGAIADDIERIPGDLFLAIAHGDETHQAWLREALHAWFRGEPLPPARANPAPIPMLLDCPDCFLAHIDVGEWATRPHRTHKCVHCGNEWRPANVPTRGVQALD